VLHSTSTATSNVLALEEGSHYAVEITVLHQFNLVVFDVTRLVLF